MLGIIFPQPGRLFLVTALKLKNVFSQPEGTCRWQIPVAGCQKIILTFYHWTRWFHRKARLHARLKKNDHAENGQDAFPAPLAHPGALPSAQGVKDALPTV